MVKLNKTQKKDTLRLIRNTKGRFFSLMAIIIIGVAFFVGVSGSSYIMGKNVDAYADETNLKDITIYSNYGFDDEDVDAVSQMSKVDKAEGSKFVDVLANSSNASKVTRVHSYSENSTINQFVLKEGRLPQNKNEVLAEKGTDMAATFSIGDELTLSRPDDDLDDYLNVEKVTVVGLIDTPLYINETKETSTLSNQYIATYLYIPKEAFSLDYYTEINVLTKDGKSMYAFSDEYKDYCAEVKEDIQDLGIVQSKNRRDSIVEQAKEEYQEGYEEYKEALKEYEDGISDGEEQLQSAEEQLQSGKKQIESAKQTLVDSQSTLNSEITSNKALLDEKNNELQVAKQQLEQAKEQLDANSDNIEQARSAVNVYDTLTQIKNSLPDNDEDLTDNEDYQNTLKQLKELGIIDGDTYVVSQVSSIIDSAQQRIIDEAGMSIDEIRSSIQQYDDGLQQYNDGISQLNTAQSEIDSAYQQLESTQSSSQSQIDSGWNEIEENESTLSDSETQLNEGKSELEEQKISGKQQLEEAKEKLDKAKQDIEDLESGKWTVLDRTSHYGMETYAGSVDQMAAIGNIFPVFFFLVAALVCLTTMTRMIDEERGQIGILRALGYTEIQCASKYLIYAFLATIIGCVIGSVLGTLTFPIIIYEAWKMLYIEPSMKLYIPWHLIGIATVSFLAVMLLTTFSVCHKSMKEVPSQLLRPASPKLGKSSFIEHIGLIWNHLSFTWKVTIRNLLRYKKRLVMTVIGVGGCTALMVIGFGVRDSIDQMVKLQFTDITHYDGFAKLSDDISEEDKNEIIQKVEDDSDVASLVSAVSYSGKISYNDTEETVLTQVFTDNDEISKLYTLRTRKGHHEISIDDSGVVISEKLSEDLGVKIGDTVTIESKYGVQKEVTVSAITEMYIQHYAFLNEDLYEELFDTSIDPDTLFIVSAIDNSSNLQKMLASDERVESISFYDVTLENFNNMVKTLDFIIIVLIASSLALAFVVLGNLMNINISERQREIATLKVLGFRKREVQSYIYKENNVLTILGAIAGLPLGVALHHWIMHELQFSYVMYGVDVMPLSLIVSIILTSGFGILVNQLMKKKLAAIEMVESLKSVE
jgi:putative ABC transport system permease protein